MNIVWAALVVAAAAVAVAAMLGPTARRRRSDHTDASAGIDGVGT
jgi:hypothetical protein